MKDNCLNPKRYLPSLTPDMFLVYTETKGWRLITEGYLSQCLMGNYLA